jgi:hypothetical protein
MNYLDYLVNAMTGGQPTQQELMARQMAQQGLLNQDMSALPPVKMPEYSPPSGQLPSVQMPQVGRQPGTLPPVQMPSSQMSPYMQNLTNPGMTMQQNYVDPRLIEQMYYKGLLSR